MKQSILIGPGQSQVVERPVPTPGPDDVLVRVRACGVCASELHTWQTGEAHELGHEVAGEVVAVGERVQDLAIGTPVTGLFQRGYAEYACTLADRVAPLPPGMHYDEALGEPLSCIISGARRTRVELGDTVAIVGMGFMGLLMLQAMRLKGPVQLIAIDTRDEPLAMARTFGADEAIRADAVDPHWKLVSWDQLSGGYGVDVAIEASGTQGGLTLAGQLARAHGVLSIVGYHQGGLRQVDMELWNWKALDVLNAHERRADYQMDCLRRGLALVSAGKMVTAPLVTHRFGLGQVDEAFQALMAKPGGYIKGLVVPEG